MENDFSLPVEPAPGTPGSLPGNYGAGRSQVDYGAADSGDPLDSASHEALFPPAASNAAPHNGGAVRRAGPANSNNAAPPGGFAGGAAALGINPVNQMIGEQLFSTGHNLVQQKLSSWGALDSVMGLKYYFAVSNSYVLNKLRLLVFPFRHKRWARLTITSGAAFDTTPGPARYRPPRDDINAPDLYIPLMSFVTWILVSAILLGSALQFTPEVLSTTSSMGLAVLCLEVLVLKGGFYVLTDPSVVSPPLFEFVSYSGYKFVGVCFNMLAGVLLGPIGYWVSLLYTSLCNAYFMRGTLRLSWHNDPRNSTNRKYFILMIMLMQFVWPVVLGR